jgi:hypothetical protein
MIKKFFKKKPTQNAFWKIGKKIIGVILIVGGLLGLFLPFLQGIAMIAAGIILIENKRLIDFSKRILKRFKKNKKC